MTTTLVIPTGTANLKSVLFALERAGASPRLWAGEDVVCAERVVLPGVGAFDAGITALTDQGLVAPLQARVRQGRPTLGICLGLQLFAEASDEGQARGLGVVSGRVRALPSSIKVPHLGWNLVEGLGAAGFAYFANSFALREVPPGWEAAWTTHGDRFVSALSRRGVLLCQFHPELSGTFGARVLRRWLQQTEAQRWLAA
jgi:glutamine amidotransferase